MRARVAEPARRPTREAGFTLVETLVAVVILVFGLMAVTNLLLVAASSNTAANQSTAATASAAQIMDTLRVSRFANLAVGGSLDADTTNPAQSCATLNDWSSAASGALDAYNCVEDIPGVGRIRTRWQITPVAGTARMLHIAVRSEGDSALGAGRSRATFTTLRACTNSMDGSCGPGQPCCPQ